MVASTSLLKDWSPDKDNPNTQHLANLTTNMLKRKPTLIIQPQPKKLTKHTTYKKPKIKKYDTIYNFNNNHSPHQLYSKTPTFLPPSHISFSTHMTKSLTDISDDKTAQAQNTNTPYTTYTKSTTMQLSTFINMTDDEKKKAIIETFEQALQLQAEHVAHLEQIEQKKQKWQKKNKKLHNTNKKLYFKATRVQTTTKSTTNKVTGTRNP